MGSPTPYEAFDLEVEYVGSQDFGPCDGAHVDLIIGRWGEGAESADRSAVSLIFHPAPGVRVIDASERSIARHALVGRGLRRDEVIGTPLARDVFALIDAIWLQDDRIAEVSGRAGQGRT